MTGRHPDDPGPPEPGDEETPPPRKARAAAGRVPPHALEAETALLGAAMLNAHALETLATRTRPADFYKPAHGHVAAALVEAYETQIPTDPVSLADLLDRHGRLDAIGGISELVALQNRTPTTSGADRYAEIVHEKATLRRVIAAAGDIADIGYGHTTDAHQAVLAAQGLLDQVAANNGARAYSSLAFGDVAAIVAGDIRREDPTLLTRSDGLALFYAAKMHILQGEPTSGKSWIALQAAVEILELGGAVLYLDYEDSPEGIIGRLLALQADPAAVTDRFVYVRPDGPFGPTERIELTGRLDALNPDLVVIDGVAEALARDGLSEDKAPDVVAWIEKLPRWLARTGAAVVMLDHVAKDRETRGRWARGSGAKAGAVDGAAYEVRIVESFSRHRAGKIRLVVAKDRPGAIGVVGATAAVAAVEPHAAGERVVIRLDAPPPEGSPAAAFRPTVYMERLSRQLELAATPLTATGLLAATEGRPKILREALRHLQEEGYVQARRQGRSDVLESIRPFRRDDDTEPPPPGDDDAPRDYSDESLFADWQPPQRDELAERRRSRDQELPQ